MRLNRAGLVILVEPAFHLFEEREPVIELLAIHERLEVFDAAGGVHDVQGLMPGPKKAGTIAAGTDRDEVRHRRIRPPDLRRGDGAEAGVDETADAFLVAGVHVKLRPAVRALAGAHPAKNRAMVHEFGDFGKVFAYLDAGHRRVSWLEL